MDSCPEDFERLLTHRGTIEAKEIAKRIVHRDLVPDLILTSPAERAWATASMVAGICELDGKQVRCDRSLYLATPETTWRVLNRHDLSGVKHLMICGHNPGLSQLASRLGPKPEARDLPTAGIATAVWNHGDWTRLQPEMAILSELDDPESMADLWA